MTANLKTSGSYLIGGFGSIADTLAINLVIDALITPDQVRFGFKFEPYQIKLTSQNSFGRLKDTFRL